MMILSKLTFFLLGLLFFSLSTFGATVNYENPQCSTFTCTVPDTTVLFWAAPISTTGANCNLDVNSQFNYTLYFNGHLTLVSTASTYEAQLTNPADCVDLINIPTSCNVGAPPDLNPTGATVTVDSASNTLEFVIGRLNGDSVTVTYMNYQPGFPGNYDFSTFPSASLLDPSNWGSVTIAYVNHTVNGNFYEATPVEVFSDSTCPEAVSSAGESSATTPVESSTTSQESSATTPVESSTTSQESSATTPVESSTTSQESSATTPVESSTTSQESSATPVESSTTSVESSTTSQESSATPVESSTTSVESSTTSVESSTTSVESSTTSVESSTTSQESSTTPVESSTTSVESSTTPVESSTTSQESSTTPEESSETPEESSETPEESSYEIPPPPPPPKPCHGRPHTPKHYWGFRAQRCSLLCFPFILGEKEDSNCISDASVYPVPSFLVWGNRLTFNLNLTYTPYSKPIHKPRGRTIYGQAQLSWDSGKRGLLGNLLPANKLKWEVDVPTGDLITVACEAHSRRHAELEVSLRDIRVNGDVVLQNIFDRNNAKYGVIRDLEDLDRGFIFTADMQIKTSRLLTGSDRAFCQVMVQRDRSSTMGGGGGDKCARVSDVEMNDYFQLGDTDN